MVERLGQIEARYALPDQSEEFIFKGASGQAIMAEMMDQLRADHRPFNGTGGGRRLDYLTGQSCVPGRMQ